MTDSTAAKSDTHIDILQIMKMIPHRYPFLLVDKLVECNPPESAVGVKNVTFNEPQFMGHFPGAPVMPGVLIVEAMAQTAAIVVVKGMGLETAGKLVYFMSIEEARFRRPVQPGDTMYIHVNKVQSRRNVWKFSGQAKVDGVVCAEAVFTAMIVDESQAASL
jgi:3-hydroxyacyl-[acyl-carrier-protein] dehydratase